MSKALRELFALWYGKEFLLRNLEMELLIFVFRQTFQSKE